VIVMASGLAGCGGFLWPRWHSAAIMGSRLARQRDERREGD
jgi:hypothetical protein